jgi:N-methylhydantoinase B
MQDARTSDQIVASDQVDGITVELVNGALEAALREMEAIVDRTSMSAGIKEKKDRFIGIYDSTGRLISAHLAFTGPGLIGEHLFQHYPVDDMKPGDVFWFNDPYFTQGAIQHLGDMCFATPVFGNGKVIAFSTAFGHFRDIGGAKPGSISPSATEIFQEGLRIPAIRIFDGGKFNDEAYRIILANSRFPIDLEGDTRAMMAASRLGESRLNELVTRFGSDTLVNTFEKLITETGEAARRDLRNLVPEGDYSFFDYVDSDGLGSEPIRVAMTLSRVGDTITVDLSDSGPQTRGPVNFIATHGFINHMFGVYLRSHNPDLLLNEGLFQVIDHVVTKPGTIVQPTFPAATGLRSHSRLRLSSCMLGVLGEATNGQASANSPVYAIYVLALNDPDTGKLDMCTEGIGAGLGARPYSNGVDAIYFIAQQNFPIEFIEQEHLIRVEKYQIRQDSGGPGKFRGGCGVTREVRVLASGILRTRLDNVLFPCWGANGGLAGRPGQILINPGTEHERTVPSIGDDTPVQAGDLLQLSSGGGGGWGDPFTRPIESVQLDVLRNFVTVEGAKNDYGVIIDPDTLEVDVNSTGELRNSRKIRVGEFDRGVANAWLSSVGVSN